MTRSSAPAKINLCLHVTKQLQDGLHELESLVTFLDCGEWVEVAKGFKTELKITGPQNKNLKDLGDNLIFHTTRLFPRHCYSKITLHKTMPIASGIGGGSADAAAAIKSMCKVWELPFPNITTQLKLGADVPVCMYSQPVLVKGVGEKISLVLNFPKLFCCLVNPGVAVATADIFRELNKKENPSIHPIPKNEKDWLVWLAKQRNDLQKTATLFVPEISFVLKALNKCNPIVSRMSGSGATCYALFDTLEKAKHCSNQILKQNPKWWTAAGALLQ